MRYFIKYCSRMVARKMVKTKPSGLPGSVFISAEQAWYIVQ